LCLLLSISSNRPYFLVISVDGSKGAGGFTRSRPAHLVLQKTWMLWFRALLTLQAQGMIVIATEIPDNAQWHSKSKIVRPT
jgi:hypothetical protein